MAITNLGNVALKPKGEWLNTTAYLKNDIVSYQGSMYLAKSAPPIGNVPTDTTYWMLSAAKGIPGDAVPITAWSSATAYTVGAKVTYGGSSYYCIANHTNQAPPNATYWLLIAAKGDNTTAAAVSTGDGSNVQAKLDAHASQLADSPNYRKVTGNPSLFYPVPASSLAVKALLTAIQAGSGDPSPTNIRPISPAVAAGGAVAARLTGKNIWRPGDTATSNGITKTVNADGSITLNGTASNNAFFNVNMLRSIDAAAFVLSANNAGTSAGVILRVSNSAGATIGEIDLSAANRVSAAFAGSAYTLTIRVALGTVLSNFVVKPQLEIGSVASAFEAYVANDYTLTAQQAKYGLPGAEAWMANDGSEGDPTELVTLTGAEAGWVKAGSNPNTYYLDYGGSGGVGNAVAIAGICNQFKRNPAATTALADGECNVLVYTTNPYRIIFRRDACTTVEEWKAFLAAQNTGNTPVVILRQRVAPATATGAAVSIPALAQIDRYTPRQNLVTVDKGTPEVGYAKSPIRTEDELLAAIAALA